ncbi:hypothetical protein CTI12_AA020260 [Artemisia annua]|uniref:Uncharacterized protein n=1 Tax=Artemisia annua TaxID=35608 RepID=A0A2U1QK36_ARTAN|nr:hypothetical protein CTI12_AA020260 [Artemisia annua]
MSDTSSEPRKYRKLSIIYKEDEPIRGVANFCNSDSKSSSPEEDSDEFTLKKHRRKSKGKRVAPNRSGAKRKTPLSKGKVVSKLGKRGRKPSSSVRCETSTSGTKKGSLSHGSKNGTEMVQNEMPKNLSLQLGGHNSQITEKNNCSVSALGVKEVQLAQPAMTLSKYILASSNDEISSALQLVSLSNGPPASGPGLPQSEPIEPETLVCVMNRNPSEFCTEIAKNYMRSGYPSL